MSDLVRVKLENGAEATVGAEYAEVQNLKVLDKPAVDARGVALDAKYPVTVDEAAAEKADDRTPQQKAADTRAEKKAQAEAEAAQQAAADAAGQNGDVQ